MSAKCTIIHTRTQHSAATRASYSCKNQYLHKTCKIKSKLPEWIGYKNLHDKIKWYKHYISSFKYAENDYITTTISLSTKLHELRNSLHNLAHEPVVTL